MSHYVLYRFIFLFKWVSHSSRSNHKQLQWQIVGHREDLKPSCPPSLFSFKQTLQLVSLLSTPQSSHVGVPTVQWRQYACRTILQQPSAVPWTSTFHTTLCLQSDTQPSHSTKSSICRNVQGLLTTLFTLRTWMSNSVYHWLGCLSVLPDQGRTVVKVSGLEMPGK